MPFRFNRHGWFTGTGDGPRTTEVPPPITNTDDTPGLPRANFVGVSGREWEIWLYTAPPDDPPPDAEQPPNVVSMVDFRVALFNMGLDTAVANTIAAYPEPKRTRVGLRWQYGSEVHLRKGVSQDLGLTQGQLRTLFLNTVPQEN